MTATYRILSAEDLRKVGGHVHAFSSDVLVGLSKSPKQLPSRYFYDERGSRLFQKIMELPEYYLTRCEIEILKTKKEKFSRIMSDEPFNLVELGAGDGSKTSILIHQFLKNKREFHYIPIDISESAMKWLIRLMNRKFPRLDAQGIVAEYFDGVKWLSQMNSRRNLVLFLGSNLGNFDRSQSRVFLHSLWNTLNHGDHVVIGFDLKKKIELMMRAYNDSKGITSAFNMNLLERINRELGGNFNLEKFRHYAGYDVFSGAMESYVVSLESQTVFIKEIGQSFDFKAWEPIHTEYSYKYLESDIEKLAQNTGYTIEQQFFDSKRFFVDSVWTVLKKDGPE